MGFFNRQKDIVYSLGKAKELLRTKKYENYTTIPEGNGFRIVPMEQLKKHMQSIKDTNIRYEKEKRSEFMDRISNHQKNYKNDELPKSYNKYESVRNYKQDTTYVNEI